MCQVLLESVNGQWVKFCVTGFIPQFDTPRDRIFSSKQKISLQKSEHSHKIHSKKNNRIGKPAPIL